MKLIEAKFGFNQNRIKFRQLVLNVKLEPLMSFNVSEPFLARPPRLKDLVNHYVMGDVWVRDTPFGSITDSLVLAEKFGLTHGKILRSIDKCKAELAVESKYNLSNNLIENHYRAGSKGRLRNVRKVDITEFGLVLLLLYINSPKARQISAEILYRFFVLNTYVKGLTDMQIGAIKGYYRKQVKNS